MSEWQVVYECDGVALRFICMADDEDHAKEQCINAYPECTVIDAFLTDWVPNETPSQAP